MDKLPYIAIVCAFVLIHVPRQVATVEMKKLAGGYDNRDPRTQSLALVGRGKRAMNAHMNGFEAFAPFAVAVLAAEQRGVSSTLLAVTSMIFIAARAFYIYAYVGDLATPRSAAWAIGAMSSAALMLAAAIA